MLLRRANVLTGHEEAVLQRRQQVRVCFCVDQVLLDLVEHLAGALGLHVDLEEGSTQESSSALKHADSSGKMEPLAGLTASKRLDMRSSSSFLNISKKSRCLEIHSTHTYTRTKVIKVKRSSVKIKKPWL